MNPTVLLAAVCGALVTVGAFTAILGLIPVEPTPASRSSSARWQAPWRWARDLGLDVEHHDDHDETARWVQWRWPLAAAGGLTVWALSGWPVAGLILTTAIAGTPMLMAASRAGQRDLRRGEAIEEWTRRLADVLTTGTGLEQAVTTTATVCPKPIRPPVNTLATRLAARWPTETALWAFADDMDDASGDLVVAALVLGTRRRGPGLASALTSIADALAEQVAARRKTEVERARPRTTARTITAITLLVLAVYATNTTYLHPYGTSLGQLALAALAAAFAATLGWLHALGRGHPQPRLLTATTTVTTDRPLDTAKGREPS
ncbi:MAG: hypothetical protein QG597_4163 [Actinomycetota bacterium]|nr:hypothetical protein [Actinomycetota bacterium]